jgi:osmotically-inducible protein OsmY
MDLTFLAVVIMSAWVVAIVAAGLVMSLRPGGVAVRLAPAGATTSVPSGRRDEILLGGDAEVFGNVRGRVRAVQLMPDSRQLQDVELASGLEGRPVPASAIVSADGQVLRLAERWAEPPLDEPRDDAATLRQDATVVSGDGKRLGKLRLVCFDAPSGIVTALVVEGRGTPSRRLLPIERVTAAGPHRIGTDLKANDWTTLHPFATDWEIRQGIIQQLATDPTLEIVRRSLTIDVEDQRVRLRGYVRDPAQAERVAQLVRSVPGVLQVQRELVSDDELARTVSDAIRRDPATSAAQVQVIARGGTVDITGEAPDRSAARRIESVARQVSGVAVVHNLIALRQQAS